ncbi:MAG: Tex family protein [Eubacteriales bacterium]|nr:Tex family protein [Eubacteriales bacterium]
MDIQEIIAEEIGITRKQADAAAELIDSGSTIPFIARYRKEATGGMDDEQLRTFDERLRYYRGLEERKQTILSTVSSEGKLTPELRKAIEDARTMSRLEDLYRPYKPKRKTRAQAAREKGLEGLSKYLLSKDAEDPLREAEKYVSPEKEVSDAESALSMAMDIIAGDLSDDAEIREKIREIYADEAVFRTEEKPADDAEKKASVAETRAEKTGLQKTEERRSVYKMYFGAREAAKTMPGHRVLAVNRGEKEKVLKVSVDVPEEKILKILEHKIGAGKNPHTETYLEDAAKDAFQRLIQPSAEKELRASMTEKAQEGALKVFGSNLSQLLMQPPLAGKTVLGWDPGFRNGCKLAVVDPTGKILETVVIYPTPPFNKTEQAKRTLDALYRKYHYEVISLGNGTASRESEKFIADYIQERGYPVKYAFVSEAGASVYSASKLAQEELPDLDVEGRGAASIARRLQDPMAELVKIDPKAVGVGQYQHDMDQKKLGEALHDVVEDSVNRVGVDLNTASAPLLRYISGVSPKVAENIVSYREEDGRFESRTELRKVPKLGPKTFEQCAGFLRIQNGKEALDSTAVHPESYSAARAILKMLGYTPSDIEAGKTAGIEKDVQALEQHRREEHLPSIEEETGVGRYTFRDIISELSKPGRDPREQVDPPILRSDVLSMEDLKPGMELQGTVRNIVDFGAFVDIGVHQDGLVHISELADRRVKHPLDVVKLGQVVKVRVLDVDKEHGRISLSMRTPGASGQSRQSTSGSSGPRSDRRNRGRAEKKRNARGSSKKQNGKSAARGNSAMLEAFRKAEARKKK